MGSPLNPTSPKDTNIGLLKTTDSTEIGASPKVISDGNGNNTGLELSTDTLRAGTYLEIGNLPAGDVATDDKILVQLDGTDRVGYVSASTIIPPYSYYDSDWINFPAYDGTSGYNSVLGTNKSLPQFRVINRMVIFRGSYYIPLDDGAGSFNTDWVTDWSNTNVAPQTTGTGLSIDARTRLVLPPLFNLASVAALTPDITMVFRDRKHTRRVEAGNDATHFADIDTYCDLEILTSSGFRINPAILNTANGDYSGAGYTYQTNKNSQRVLMNCKIDSGDKMVDFNAFKSSSNTDFSTFFGANNEQTDTYQHTIDGNYASNLGAFQFTMDGMFYMIDPSYTIEQIQAAVESL